MYALSGPLTGSVDSEKLKKSASDFLKGIFPDEELPRDENRRMRNKKRRKKTREEEMKK